MNEPERERIEFPSEFFRATGWKWAGMEKPIGYHSHQITQHAESGRWMVWCNDRGRMCESYFADLIDHHGRQLKKCQAFKKGTRMFASTGAHYHLGDAEFYLVELHSDWDFEAKFERNPFDAFAEMQGYCQTGRHTVIVTGVTADRVESSLETIPTEAIGANHSKPNSDKSLLDFRSFLSTLVMG